MRRSTAKGIVFKKRPQKAIVRRFLNGFFLTTFVLGQSLAPVAAQSASTQYLFRISPAATPSQSTTSQLSIEGPASISAHSGAAFSQVYTAAAGTAPLTWTASGLPAGVGFANGDLSGASTQLGVSSITLGVSDATGLQGSLPVALTVLPALQMGVMANITSDIRVPVDAPAPNVSGSPVSPVTWSLASGILPLGLSVNASTGAITGTPSVAGVATVALKFTDATGASVNSNSFTVSVNSPISVSSVNSATTRESLAFSSSQPSASNGVAPYSWALYSGTLPLGLNVNPSSGIISGSALAAGTASNLVLGVTDSLGAVGNSNSFSLTVLPPLAFASEPANVNLRPNAALSGAINPPALTSALIAPYTWTRQGGALPSGLQFDSTSGSIFGLPTVSGSSTMTEAVADATGGTATTSAFVLSVLPALTVSAPAPLTARVNDVASLAAPSVGGSPDSGLSVSVVGLPAGLSFDESGAISGTYTTAASGLYSYTAADPTVYQPGYAVSSSQASYQILPQLVASVQLVSGVVSESGANAVHVGMPAVLDLSAAPSPSGAVSWTVVSGSLPSGLSLGTDPNQSGVPAIVGTALSAGASTVELQGTDAAGEKTTILSLAFTVYPALAASNLAMNSSVGQLVSVATPTVTAGTSIGLPVITPLSTTAPGLFVSAGRISGTLTSVGNYTATWQVADAISTITVVDTIDITNSPALSVQSISGHTGTALSNPAPVAVNDSNLPLSDFAVISTVSGVSLPSGLAIDPSTGVISGTPTAVTGGLQQGLAVTALDSTGQTIQGSFTIDITSPLSTSDGEGELANRTARVGVEMLPLPGPAVTPGSYIAPLSYALQSGVILPPGLTLDSATGVISGTPGSNSSSLYLIRETVSDASGASLTSAASEIAVLPPLALEPTPAQVTTVGAQFDLFQTVDNQPGIEQSPLCDASVQTCAVTYTLTGTPDVATLASTYGLYFNSSNASLTGVATAVLPTTQYSIVVSDAEGAVSAPQLFTLTIGQPLVATGPSSTTGRVGIALNLTSSVAYAAGTVSWSVASGTLPSGLTLNGDGSITGSPTQSGSSTLSLAVSDTAGGSATTAPFTITVLNALTVSQPADVSVHQGQSVTSPAPVVYNNPTLPLTWSIASGVLPAGLTLNADGSVSGAMTSVGSAAITLEVVDATGATATTGIQNFTASADLVLTPPAVTVARLSSYYAGYASVSNAVGSSAFSASNIPAGMHFNAAGFLNGTPTALFSDTINLSVTDSTGSVVSLPFAFQVLPQLSISTPANMEMHVGQTASFPGGIVSGSPVLPETWSLFDGNPDDGLPGGLSLQSDGSVAGTARVAKTQYETETVVDALGYQATSGSFRLFVYPAMTLSNLSSATFRVGFQQSASLSVTNAIGGVTWSASGLPDGLTIDQSGNVTGIPTTSGVQSATITATDSIGGSVSQAYSITVRPALTATTPASVSGVTGTSVATTAPVVSNNPALPLSWELASGTLPAGMALNGDGSISGTPSTYGVFPVSLEAFDSSGNPGATATTGVFTITIANAFTIAAISDAGAHQGTSYAALVSPQAPAAAAPVSWSLASGTLPSGLSLNSATGVISGTPAIGSGTFPIALSAVDSTGYTTTSNSFNIILAPVLTVATVGAQQDHADLPLSFGPPVVGNGVGQIAWSLASGSLPSGVSLNSSTGLISGTPGDAAVGSYNFTLSVTDSYGGVAQSGSNSLAILNALSIATPAGVTVHTGQSVAVAAPSVAASAVAPVSFALASGSLPSGVSLNSNGSISGSSSIAGSNNYALTVTDQTGEQATSGSFTIAILAPLAVNVPSQSSGRINVPQSLQSSTSNAIGSVSWSATGLPSGFSISQSGLITGTTSVSGTYSVVISATDQTGEQATANYALTINPSIVINTIANVQAHQTSSYATLVAPSTLYDVKPDSWSLASGTLPAGLSMSTSTGKISGTPTDAVGTYPVSLGLIDSTGTAEGGAATSNSFTIGIVAPLSNAVAPNVTMHVGTNYVNGTVPGPTVSNAVGLQDWVVVGSAPSDLSYYYQRGWFSGTPSVGDIGSYTLSFTVGDQIGGSTTSNAFTLSILPALSVSTPASTTVHSGDVVSTAAPVVSGSAVSPLTFSLDSNSAALPSGLSLNASTGVISGTAASVASLQTASIILDVVDAAQGAASTGSFQIAVAPALSLAAIASQSGRINVPYAQSAPSVANAIGTVTWSASGLPSGLSVNASNGSISGISSVTGSFNPTLTATDSSGSAAGAASQTFALTILPALSVTTPSSASVGAGNPVSIPAPSVSNSPVAPVTWSLASGSLPSGVTLNTSTGVISGSSSTLGTSTLVLQVTDAKGAMAETGSFTLSIVNDVVIAPIASVSAHINTAYAALLSPSVSNAAAPVTWTLASGTLPTGLNLSSATGVISGTPTASAGSYVLQLLATDNNGIQATSNSFTITLLQPLTVAALPSVSAHASSPYNEAAPSVSNANGSVTWSLVSGTLPSGLSLNSSTGTVTGTPGASTAGSYPLNIQVADQAGGVASTGSFTLTIVAALAVSTPAGSETHVNQSTTIAAATVSGAPQTPYTWSIASGALPSGMSLNTSTGVITGSVASVGSSSVALQVVDALGGVATTGSFSIKTDVAMVLTPPSTVSGRVNASLSLQASVSNVIGTATWSATGLPSGLSISQTGLLTGSVASTGTYAITLQVVDSTSSSVTANYSLTINPQVSIASISNVQAHQTTAYASLVQPVASNDVTPDSWSVTSGSLPSGLSIASTNGVISGTPSASVGTYPLTLGVTDSSGASATSNSFNVGIVAPFGLPTFANVYAHAGSNFQTPTPVVSNGVGVLHWTLSGTVPSDFVFQSTYGFFYGYAEGALAAGDVGTYPISLSACDSINGCATSNNYNVIVLPALAITTTETNISQHIGNTVSEPAPTVSNAASPVTFALSSGSSALPSGLSLNTSSGTISGTTSGSISSLTTYTESVVATDSTTVNNTGAGASIATANFTINLYPALTISGVPASQTSGQGLSTSAPTVSNAIGTVTWTASGLPSGVTLNSATGVLTISGSAASGTYSISMTAADSSAQPGGSASALTSLTISPPLAVTAPSTTTLAWGAAASLQATASNTVGTVTWSASGLPSGLSINASTGLITGSVTSTSASVIKTYSATISANDSRGVQASQSYSLTVTTAVSLAAISNNTIHSATAVANVATAAASGGTGPYTYAIASGYSLPSGLTLSNGVLAATTSLATGTYTLEIQANDANGQPALSNSFTVTAVGAQVITAPSTTSLAWNTAANLQSTSTNAVGSVTWSLASGSLPTGLSLGASTGLISGTVTSTSPSVIGSFPVTLKVVDSTSASATQAYTLTITSSVTVAAISNQTVAAQTAGTILTGSASGGTSPYTWSEDASYPLPSGFTLSSAGVLSATSSLALGTYTLQLQANDANGQPAASNTFTVTAASESTQISTFTASSTWTAPAGVTTLSYLVVGGGGGGASSSGSGVSFGGGGGGAGQVTQGSVSVTPGTTYTITVGSGGPGGLSGSSVSASAGSNGNSSSISGSGLTTITAVGGSGAPAPTGSGAASGGASGNGYAGGTAFYSSGNYAGGGGGAGAAGANGAAGTNGNGGAGVASSISGSSVYYGGGGGGNGNTTSGGNGGTGEVGTGGSAKAQGHCSNAGCAGSANTGSGGGGGSYTGAGGAGGSGIVILSYIAL